jgi:phage FluMu gp28-like protein
MAAEDGAAYTLRFANGTDINSVASKPDVFAGKGGNVILDEFALRRDPQSVYGIASPTIDWGGRLAIVSTHRGANNYFNNLITEIREKGNPKGFSHHRVTLQDALDQGFLWKVQTKLRDGDPRLDMDEAINHALPTAAGLPAKKSSYRNTFCNPPTSQRVPELRPNHCLLGQREAPCCA